MSNWLFTFVVDYEGGTYISQVVASRLRDAIDEWPKVIDWQAMRVRSTPSWSDQFKSKLQDERPVPIEGIENVWCISPEVGKSVATVHIIATVAGAIAEI